MIHLEECAQLKQDHFSLYRLLGSCYGELGQFLKAEESILRSSELDKKDHLSFIALGLLYEKHEMHEKSEQAHRSSIDRKPNSSGYSCLGSSLIKQKKYSEAKKVLEIGLELFPDYEEIHINYGAALLDLGLYEQAEVSFFKALEIDPKYEQAYYGLAKIEEMRGNHSLQRKYLKRVTDDSTNNDIIELE